MNAAETRLAEQLAALKLVAVAEQYAVLASEAAQKQWLHVDYLARLIDSEAQRRHQLAIQRRVTSAVLDRLLHHAETVIIEGKSSRMKDQIEAP